ncbi:MAG: hypothetical protein ACR2LC_11055 [Pyrinomonadaceae bacterium]
MELIWTGGNLPQQTTGLLRVLPLLAVTLLPAANYTVHQQESGYNRAYTNVGNQYYRLADPLSEEQQQMQIIQTFAANLLENTKDVDADIARITSEQFWEMYEPF